MTLQDILAPNLRRYQAQLDGEYVSTRVITHNGTTVAVALAKAKNGVLSFNYSILDTTAGSQMDKQQASSTAAVDEKPDSKCWFDNVKTLNFASEVRVIGEEAVPVYQIPAVDRSNRKTVRSPAHGQKLDEWLSSSLCLIDQDVLDFQLLSDGRYVYLFRQSAPMQNGFPNQFMTEGDAGNPPVDRNLLCDRFILVGSTLNRPLEARYQRSRQKQIPLNDQDTLSVKDINGEPFYEPTYSLRFVKDLELGRFCVLRAPTMINNVAKWMIFASSHKTGEVECLTTDVSSNGLFDLHGHVYYTCQVKEHGKVFANGPGPCTATRKDDGRICGKARVPILPKTPASKRSVELSNKNGLTLQNQITSLLEGFTLEVWVQPEDSIDDTGSLTDSSVKGGFSLFRFSENSLGVFINDKYHVEIRKHGEDNALVVSGAVLEAKAWSHVAITYDPSTPSYAIIINGVTSGSITSKLRPGALLGLGPQSNGSSSCFKGLFDELRLWRRPLHPSTIKSKMHSRATGLELDLKSCWHFDEGSGMTAFDATSSHHLTITSTEGRTKSPDVWQTSSAPMVGSHGIARKVLRVPSSVKTTGGLCATVYHEQVAVSEEKADTNDGSGSTPDAGGDDEPKNMKRGARVLLGFVVNDKSPPRLAILDFCLLSDGTLCDTPALIPLPTLSMPAPTSGDTSPHHDSLNASTALLYVGGEGLEIFGGILPLDTIECEPSEPCAFESGTGSVTIFFKGKSLDRSSFSALKYNISRKVIATELSASILGGHKGLLSTSKLQQAVNVVFETKPCPWAVDGLAVNLTLTANMPDGNKIIETWAGLPSQIDKFCSLINGPSSKPDRVGALFELNDIPNNGEASSKVPSVEISLRAGAEVSVAAGTFLNIGSRSYFVLQDAKIGDKVLVATMFNDKRPEGKPPMRGLIVLSSAYDHKDLIKCSGKPARDFAKGSGIVSMAWSPSAVASGQAATSSSAKIQASGISYIKGSGQSPSFGSPPRSTSLRLDGMTTYSMIEDTVATAACAGICFEAWIKAESNPKNTIVVAYKSERLPRADGSSKEEQKFVLGITQPPDDKDTYHMVGSINDLQFMITKPSVLKPDHWSHLACSSRSTFAVRFSGHGYIDLGKTEQWNVSDFSLAFSLQLKERVDHEQPILVKGDSSSAPTPLKIEITKDGNIRLCHWAADNGGSNVQKRTFESRAALLTGQAYKIFISRKSTQVSGDDEIPKTCQVVTMRAWRLNGECDIAFPPETEDKSEQLSELTWENPPRQFHDAVQGNEASLYLGGAQWTETQGLQGIIGSVQLYSSAIQTPASPLELCGKAAHDDSLIGSWSCRKPGGFSLIDDHGRNNGKLQGDLDWVVGPYKSDYALSIFLNAIPVNYEQPDDPGKNLLDQATPAGPQQLSVGNILVSNEDDDDDSRFLGLEQGFCGELDELRIWNVPRTSQDVCDSMNTSLTEISGDLAVYLPFHDEKADLDALERSHPNLTSVLTDASVNCWHLTPLSGAATTTRASEAPVGHDSPCVNHTLGTKVHQPHGADIRAGPSVAEYGEMEISSSGNMEGSYKRAYSYIDKGGDWCLVTGFRIGALKTEWVSQVQTSPTLIGFIEGAPPLPIESFTDRDRPPTTSVKFENNTRCTYTYSARSESTISAELSWSKGAGIKWDVEAGVAVQTEISEGKTRGSVRRGIDTSCGKVNNEVHTSTTNSNLEMAVQLTSIWKESTSGDNDSKSEGFEPVNTGLALVESEVADVFALRLQMRGSIAPVVAYQLRPNPDIPKDRNLISFEINPKYTKQGCLDGRHGLTNDPDYPAVASAPKDASYYKPVEAYALRERIRRAEEQLQGEYDRRSVAPVNYLTDLPQRTHRNICNAYVWTADGGTFQETRSTLDMVQSEIGGNLDYRNSVGASVETEVSIGSLLTTGTVDAMASAHFNFVITKEKASEEGFELVTELPPPVDLRCQDPDTGEYIKRAGAVDAYRWMSFWLEPSVEATDTFFEHVLDHTWLEDSSEPNALLLRTLHEGMKKETGNARTKAWRVLHRCTYVSRIPENVEPRPAAAMALKEQKPSTLLADIGCNWLLIQKLEPFARDAVSRGNLATSLKPHVLRFFPTLIAQTRLYNQVLDMLADYVGLP